MRVPALVLVASLVLSTRASAQQPSAVGGEGAGEPADEQGAACVHPAPPRPTRDVPVFLTLAPADTLRPLPTALLALLAQELATPMRRTERRADGALGLASADDDHAPSALRTRATLDLHGDGTVSDLEIRPGSDARLAAEVGAAFDVLVRQGGIGPFTDRPDTLSVPLTLSFRTRVDSATGQSPLFRLQVPPSRPVAALPGNRPPRYPEQARQRSVEATIILQFLVDENGEPIEESIKSIQPRDSLPEDMELHFRSFERAAMKAVTDYRFTPAEHLGCRVKMYVRMPFAFDIAR